MEFYLKQCLIIWGLGWSPGNDIEIFDKEYAVNNFDLKNVLANPAIFDTQKLLWMNGQYIREFNEKTFNKIAHETLETSLSRELFREEIERINLILPVVQERLETLNDLTGQVKFLLDEPFNVTRTNGRNSIQNLHKIILQHSK